MTNTIQNTLTDLRHRINNLNDEIQTLHADRNAADYVRIQLETDKTTGFPFNDKSPIGDIIQSDDGKIYLTIEIFTDGHDTIPNLKTELQTANNEYINHINGFIFDYLYGNTFEKNKL